ncbi:MAG TPA: OmpA family protein [Prolixibacteraceae bacterium]|nr:OmpA family protein [Prolixibacteraceae bacterium]
MRRNKLVAFHPYLCIVLVPLVALIFMFSSCKTTKIEARKSISLVEKAKSAILSGDYLEAENLILKAIQSDTTAITPYLLLSDISEELKKTEQQKFALHKALSIDSLYYKAAYKLLGGLYFTEGNYKEALNFYLFYQPYAKAGDSSFVNNRINSARFSIQSIAENRQVLIDKPGEIINTSRQEYWPGISTNDSALYFTRLLTNDMNMPYERIFVAELGSDGWELPEELSISDDQATNIGTVCISADGKWLFFTACGLKNGFGSCDIYYARRKDNRWIEPRNAGAVINTSAWEAQPSVSSDNRFLYFASNRSGGQGGMDIWCCEMTEMKDGYFFFSKPQNLGRKVNTPANDFSPFIHADGKTLYYSSEGKYGFGGSDIYVSRYLDGGWSEAENLGYPINSRFNDDGLAVSPSAKTAFFASNREGSIGGSKDLFRLHLPEIFKPNVTGYIKGFVYDSESGERLEADIEITLIETGSTHKVTSSLTEGFITTVNAGEMYAMHVRKDGYLFYSRHFDLKQAAEFHQAEQFDINLEPVKQGGIFVLNNVFFDFNSDVLKPESEFELKKLTNFLRDNIGISIEISGHTDNTGSVDYNVNLSERRAKAIVNYLSAFIDPERLLYRGYGSSRPIADNETEAGRAKNRRCEIKILSK